MKKITIFAVLLVVLIILRVPGLSQPYHQDEYKWANIVAVDSPTAGTIPHPPLSEKLYIATDRVFGNDNLRVTPFIFSIINLFLLYSLVKFLYGDREAVWSSFLFTISFFSVLASLMVDTDGQVLPALLLIAAHGYFRASEPDRTTSVRIAWILVFALAMLVGFLTKLSFVIPLGAFALDALITYRHKITKKVMAIAGLVAIVGAAVVVIGLMNAQNVVPGFNLAKNIEYWKHFFILTDRNFFQTLIQVLKAVLYSSPLLIIPLFFMNREWFRHTRLWWIFLGVAAVFYLVLFDFSIGALDRYLQLVVVPLSIIVGVVLAREFEEYTDRLKTKHVVVIIAVLVVLTFALLIPHAVPPQHPKTEWISRALSLKWNFLYPFSGGSGPLGFYMSFLFMALAFIVSIVMAVVGKVKPRMRKLALVTLVAVGVLYNAAFIQEYLFGKLYGYAPGVLQNTIGYIGQNDDIKKVITYNDTGTYELQLMGKYERRIYAVPEWEEGYKQTLSKFSGHYLVVDIPRLNENSFYTQYFSQCEVVYQTRSVYITGTVYDCRNARIE